MNKTFFTRLVTLFLLLAVPPLTPLLADLPSEFLVVEVFSPKKRVLWQGAVGIAVLQPFYHSTDQPGRSYRIRSLPEEQSPLIKVFSQFDLQADVPSDREEPEELKEQGWEDREIRKEIAFLDWPFFVSTFGYMEDLPDVVRLPILESRNGWIKVLADWDSPRTGWLRYDQDESLEVLFFPTNFGDEWIGEGADPHLVLVSETMEV